MTTTPEPLPPAHPAEDLLSQGAPSGPRLDRVWARVEASLDAQARTQKTATWRRFLWITLPVVFSTAAVFVVLDPSASGTFTARGTPDVAPPQLLATCGTAAQACQVDVPIFLKLAPHVGQGFIYVALLNSDGAQLLAGPLASSTAASPVPVKLVPDTKDRGATLRVTAVWTPRAVEGPALDVLLRGGDAPRTVLTLPVEP